MAATKKDWGKVEPELLERYGFDADEFADLQQQVRTGARTKATSLLKGKIEPARPGDVPDLPADGTPEGERYAALGEAALRRGEVAVVVVAGGMATRFGGGAKGVVEVKDGRSFIGLDLLDLQLAAKKYGKAVPFGLMTSFATHEAIERHLAEEGLNGPDVELFTQGISLRLTPQGDVALDAHGAPSYYAPGHGDFFVAIKRKTARHPNGLLAAWRARPVPIKTVFFKNVDNQGATVNTRAFAKLLGYHLEKGNDMTAEVVAKVPGDTGGVVARVDGRLRGVEGFRLTGDQSIFPDFSPNNIYFKAEALERDLRLEHHYVEKKAEGASVVQLEKVTLEASGAVNPDGSPALTFGAIRVPRTRFLPVKERGDLATLQRALDGELGRDYGLR